MFIYQTAQYHIPEDHNLDTHCHENSDLKLHHKEAPARTAGRVGGRSRRKYKI
jgi:hypothetical protein